MSRESTVKCGVCGLELDERADIPSEAREACPRCGSTKRQFTVSVSGTLMVSGSLSGKVIRIETPQAAEAVTQRVVESGRRVTWYRYPDGLYFVQVHDDEGTLLAAGGGDDPEDALLEIAESLLPPDA